MAQQPNQQKQNDLRGGQASPAGQRPQTSAPQGGPGAPADLEALFEKSRDLFEKVAQKHITPDRLIKVALLARAGNDYLKLCTAESLLRCCLQCAELGLEPSGTYGGAHLVPRKNGKTNNWECTLVIDYRGLVELARRSGEVVLVEVGAVYEQDGFVFKRGLNPVLDHEPRLTGERGALVGYWAVVVYRDGSKTFEVMRLDEVEAIRDAVPYWDKGPWKNHPVAMGKKTVVRRALNLAPKSKEYRRALEIDDDAETVDGEVIRRELPAATGIQVDFSPKSRAEKVTADLKAQRGEPPAQPQSAPAPAAQTTRREPDPHADEEPPLPGDSDKPPF